LPLDLGPANGRYRKGFGCRPSASVKVALPSDLPTFVNVQTDR
jgi:hypothetical protein